MAYKIINIDTIKESMMGNMDMVKQFVQLYLIQMPLDFDALEKAVQSAIHTDIKDKAHHIKPTMQYIGAIDLKNDFQEIENLGKDHADMNQIIQKLESLKPQFSLLLEELRSLS